MKTIECNTIPQDTYPAGLYLASALWEAFEKNDKTNVNIVGIRSFWDGVKLEGLLNKKPFWIEINYATENIILLSIYVKKRIFESEESHEQTESELKTLLEQIITKLENRKVLKNP
jgi:hypothetical protein